MLNDLANELKTKKSFTNEQIQDVLGTVDKNQDGRLTKDEVYVLMRKLNP
jgi:Ca2+-binding EF-hand superfamily protein